VPEKEHLHGCFSPRGSLYPAPQPDGSVAFESEGLDEILAPVLQISPELNGLGEDSSVVLPLELGSFEALTVATVPSPPRLLASVDRVLAYSSEAFFFLLKSFAACWPVWRQLVLVMARIGGKGFEGYSTKGGEISQEGISEE
jgi:hypothetical protein